MFSPGRSGFTLVELAIVLVIIGLLVGGVLAGRNLISSAAINGTMAQMESFYQAALTFRDKYGGLPGDLSSVKASMAGLAVRGTVQGEGDGNGIIESASNSGYCGSLCMSGGEVVVFWRDLSAAGLIPGSFTVANSNSQANFGYTVTPTTAVSVDNFIPAARIGQGNYVYIYSQSGLNYFGLSGIIALHATTPPDSNKTLSVLQAQAIDQKTDDGVPQLGKVTARYLNSGSFNGGSDTLPVWAAPTTVTGGPYTTSTGPSASSCYDNASTAGATQQYSVGFSGGDNLTCALSFRTPF